MLSRLAPMLLVLAAPLAAQGPLPARDSADVLGRARAEQRQFERVRRNNLPWAWDGGSGECDERIGRFCLSHRDGAAEWDPPPEAEAIVEARGRLLRALDSAAARLPGDRWIAGQRVRYRIEAGRFDEALASVESCRSERWWCLALEGFARHYAGEAAAADSLFSRMLDAMPADERRAWTDLSVLLDRCALGWYRRLEPDARVQAEARFWGLADPFLARPGNEARSEHFARHVWDTLQERAGSTEGISWGDDLREILLRYGWPRGWERIRSRTLQMGPPPLVGHYASSGVNLIPPCEALRDGELAVSGWDAESREPRTGYSLPMPDSAIDWVGGVEYQVAAFRRGDSVRVVAAYEITPDSIPAEARIDAAATLVHGGPGAAHAAEFPEGGHGDVVVVSAPARDLLVSLEALALDARKAARVRHGLAVPPLPPGLIAVSDLLLVDPAEPLPDSLPAAARAARRSTRLRAGETVGVYWEVYGLDPLRPQPISLTLRLVEEGRSVVRSLARTLGLVSRVPPVRVRWQEEPSRRPVAARSLALRVPEDLSAGFYALELTLSLPGREPLVVRRSVEVAG